MTVFAGLLAIVFVITKMIGLETLSFGPAFFQLKIVAVILPLAMVLRKYGIVGISVGCPLAHLVSTGDALNTLAAFLAATTGSVVAYKIFQIHRRPSGVLAGSLAITASWVLIFGAYTSYHMGYPLTEGFILTLSSLWVGVNVVGYLLTEGLRRLMVQSRLPW